MGSGETGIPTSLASVPAWIRLAQRCVSLPGPSPLCTGRQRDIQQKVPDILVEYPVLAAIDPVQRDNILRIIIVDRFEYAELTLHRLVATNHIEKTRLDSYFLSLYRKERPTPRSGVSNTSCLPENPVQGGGIARMQHAHCVFAISICPTGHQTRSLD